ncbi:MULTISPECIES: aspartyl-phosphate phosphatase Spo0E family protein [Bacillus]|nr:MULTISPECIES: aspartyl-phosphate phosphatase Spo0E family protein [Bacillus]KRT87302.1 phosphatase [Bacillus glycinifermentans]MDU0069675.1 aspartyl-phosphate phosphatase Spo0E family protein [Bacillus sp. IG6]MEC0483481.1 aspartyl-phosphate phosphatase Spo0E family protein [Bacillus glycinifermentans]MEC3609386.1 aspartyl-phosphate phosphatase Spo0E family protein [Bacillus glycinifermentans]MED8017962.1 aspartyl-phosphate phosphatase Spo0E family protein [Bacillus glycinifermentans]
MKENLLYEIEEKRKELLQIVMTNGMTSNITIQHSQQLDILLLEYQKLSLSGSTQ